MPIADFQRSVINVGFASGNEFRFIDHFKIAEQFGFVSGSGGAGWLSGATYMQSIASDGYPNVKIVNADNKSFGGGIRIPASWQYGAPGTGQYYVAKWKGNGEVLFFLQSGSWTWGAAEQALSSNVTLVSGGNRFKTTAGADSYLVLSFTGPAQLFNIIFTSSDPNGDGSRLRNFQFYRIGDEADLLAGKVFRRPYKQTLVDACPSALRFMDWVGGNNARQTRFDTSRTLPGYGAYSINWVASPAYGETTGTNQYALAAASGTAGNPQTTPVSMVHGEIVTCRIGSGLARAGSKSVTGITNANPGVVTATAHGFSTGDVIAHQLATGVMPKLNLYPCTITVIDADTYSISVDTSTFGTFSGSASANQFTTLNVGGRGAYPIVFPSVTTYASNYGNGYMLAGDYKTFVFDKTVAMQTDGAGNYVYGVWMFNDAGANNGHYGGVPLEICVALVNEVNALGPSQPVGMWTNIPHLATSSMDPDYTTSSNWGINAVNVILNGANGYAGLSSSAKLFVEYSNETWNTGGGNAVSQTFYCAYRGFLRWPVSGKSDYSSMVALRSTVAMADIQASAYYDASRVKFVLSGQGTLGVSGLNAARIDGTTYFLSDPLNPWGAGVAPMVHHDYFAFAAYIVAQTAFDTANLANYTNQWSVADISNASAQEADCAAYVVGLVSQASGGNETCDRYGQTLVPAYATKMASYGKAVVMYEGGWDRDITVLGSNGTIAYQAGVIDGSTNVITGVSTSFVSSLSVGYFIYGYGIPDNTTVTAAAGSTITLSKNTTVALSIAQFVAMTPQNAFLRAVKRSQAWANAFLTYLGYFNRANAGMPSDYVQLDKRWGHTFPTAYGFSNSEWSDLDRLWQVEGLRNRGKRRIIW